MTPRRHTRVDLMNLKQAAEYLTVSPKTMLRLVQRRQVPSVRIGRLLRLDPCDLDEFIARSKVGVEVAISEGKAGARQ